MLAASLLCRLPLRLFLICAFFLTWVQPVSVPFFAGELFLPAHALIVIGVAAVLVWGIVLARRERRARASERASSRMQTETVVALLVLIGAGYVVVWLRLGESVASRRS